MRLLIVAAFAFVPLNSSAAQAPVPAEPLGRAIPETRSCSGNDLLHQAERSGSATFSTLDELPPGKLELTVMREVDGCPVPVIVRDNIGGDGFQQEAEPGDTPNRPRVRLFR